MNRSGILIVADDPVAASRLMDGIRATGYGLAGVARSCEEAAKMARSTHPRLAIVDSVLAEQSSCKEGGCALLDPRTIPILFAIPAEEEPRWRPHSSAAPLVQPCSERELERTIETALERHALLRRLQASEAALAAIRTAPAERQDVAQALLASEARYRAVVEGQTDIICRFLTDGTITFVNEAYCRFFGKTANDLVGRSWHPAAHPDDQSMVAAKLSELSPSNPVVVIENRVFSGDGQARWMQFANQGFFDSDGRIVEIQSVGRDITDRKSAELALRAAETFKRAILDAVSTHVAVLDRHGTLVEVNDAWRRFAMENPGQGEHPIPRAGVGTNYLDAWAQGPNAEGAQRVAHGIRVVLDGRCPAFSCEYSCPLPGTPRWFQVTVTPLGGLQDGVVITHSDITAPRLLAEELRESEENLARAQSIAHIGSWKLDLRTDRLEWSDETYRIFGVAPGTPLTLESYFSLVHPDDRDANRAAWEATAHAGAPYDREYRALIGDEIKWLHSQAEIRVDARGAPAIGFGSVQDVTERKYAELALRQSEARSRSILRAAPIGIGVTVDRVFEDVNPAMLTITGYRREELIGQSARMLYPSAAEFDFVSEEKSAQLRGCSVASLETRWRRKDGALIDIALSFSLVMVDDYSQGITFTAQDITASKRAEQERLAHEADQRDALVHEVHHRIKNNLQGVVGLLQQHSTEQPDIRLPIQAAITQINTVAVVHGLQSRISQNELRLRELLHAISGAAAALAMAPREPAIEDTLSGDVRLERNTAVTVALILNELIQNALKHSEARNGSDVTIGLDGNDQRAVIRICNPGSLPVQRPRLDTGRGCSTGLNLVRTLLPRHGAHLTLHQASGQVEARFVLGAPVTVAAAPPIRPNPSQLETA